MTSHIGIDLGTTNSLAGWIKDGKLRLIKFGSSNMLKSVLYFDGEQLLVGENAKKKGISKPKNMIRSSKTWMGDYEKSWTLSGKTFSPTDVAAEILSALREKISKKLKLERDDSIEAVITVPAYFTSNQIDETKKAGERAGLVVKKIVTEPVAAAVAYGMNIQGDEKLLVIDLGGGTFDVSILQAENSEKLYKTLALDGDKHLGGDNYDEILYKELCRRFESVCGIDFSSLETYRAAGLNDEDDYYTISARLMEEAENAKIALTENESYDVFQINLVYYKGGYKSLETSISREEFEKLSFHLSDKIEKTIKKTLESAKLTASTIDRIILVGGSAYMPKIRQIVKKIFGKSPYSDQDLSTLVVKGAAILAEPGGLEIRVNDIISHSLGIEVYGDGKTAHLRRLLLKNAVYPCSAEDIFTTVSDNQEEVSINVWEGEAEHDAELNEFYGGFVLDKIEKAKAGVPQIRVRFDFDASRILTVTGEDLKTGSKKVVQVQKGVRLDTSFNVDIIFTIDTTGSMSSYIAGVKDTCKQFASILQSSNVNYRLALVGFGDELIGEMPSIYNFTESVNTFKDNVTNCPETGGGDEPESQFDAIIKSAALFNVESNAKRIIILITDASAHGKDTSGLGKYSTKDVMQAIDDRNIIVYSITPEINYYKEFAKRNGGNYFQIQDYSKIITELQNIATAITGLRKA
jgi:molecular chaperone DnaK